MADPCLNCGPLGSVAYIDCHAALAAKVGAVPPCANAGIAQNQAGIPIIGPALGAAGQAGDTLQKLAAALATLSSPATWVRVGLFLGVLVLLIIGFTVLVTGQGNK